jgi:hypothetical protein
VKRVRDALSRFGARARDDDAALVAIRRSAGGPPAAADVGAGAVSVARIG